MIIDKNKKNKKRTIKTLKIIGGVLDNNLYVI